MAGDPSLASLSLTHVHYDPSDPVSLLSAYASLLPQAIMVTYATLLLTTREAEVGLIFAGQMASEALNALLKRVIREERPSGSSGSGYGMPSSHAQFVAYFAVYAALFLGLRHRPGAGSGARAGAGVGAGARTGLGGIAGSTGPGGQENEKDRPAVKPGTTNAASDPSDSTNTVLSFLLHSRPLHHTVLALSFFGMAATVSCARVYLAYHTPRQVLAGALAGTTFAAAWFGATMVARRCGVVDTLLDVPVVRFFRVRDLLPEQDLLEPGWREWEEVRRSRKTRALAEGDGQRKKST